MGASSWLLMHHLSFSCGNPARPRPGEDTDKFSVWSEDLHIETTIIPMKSETAFPTVMSSEKNADLNPV